MPSPDPIQVLLRVRGQREEIEERKLAAIIKELKVAQTNLAGLSAESEHITATRLSELQCVLPNAHHQAAETHTKSLWQRCADCAAEIEKLKEAREQQMLAYLSAHREREVMESLNKHRNDALEAGRKLREQKLNEDLFLARKVAKLDT